MARNSVRDDEEMGRCAKWTSASPVRAGLGGWSHPSRAPLQLPLPRREKPPFVARDRSLSQVAAVESQTATKVVPEEGDVGMGENATVELDGVAKGVKWQKRGGKKGAGDILA